MRYNKLFSSKESNMCSYHLRFLLLLLLVGESKGDSYHGHKNVFIIRLYHIL